MDWPPLRTSAWLVGPAELADKPDLIVAVVQDFLRVLDGHGISAIRTGEPREYHLTRSGFQQLTMAVTERRALSLHLMSDPPGLAAVNDPSSVDLRALRGERGATADVWLASEGRVSDSAVRIGVTTWAATTESQVADAQRMAAFMRRWSEPFHAASAFVSTNPDDTDSRTNHETVHRLPPLETWSAVRRYVRGVFWRMLLGAALCDRLGGRERVLTKAPAAIVEPVGDGVWLQLSETPAANSTAYEHMATFLAPLLSWSRADVPPPASPTLPSRPAHLPPPPDGTLPVPIKVLDPSGEDLTLNVYLTPPLTAAVKEAVTEAVHGWYMAGFDGAYGGKRFHALFLSSVDEAKAVMRWEVDLGSANWQRAILALAHWLGALADTTVQQLVVGTEVVE